MNIRPAAEADLPAIVEIYNASIPDRMATADTDPVSVESRREWFKRHTPQYPLWVLETEAEIRGWLGLRMFYGRPAYRATVEMSLYVAPRYQRQGVGSRLVEYAIAQSPGLGIRTLLGVVFGHNQPSLRLLERFGFERWGCLPRVAELDGVRRDVIMLGLHLVD